MTQAKRAKLVSFATSTTMKALEKGSIEELTSELSKLQDHLSAGFPDILKLKKKPEFINALIDARKKAFNANSELETQFAREAEELACGGKSTIEIIKRSYRESFLQQNSKGGRDLLIIDVN